MRRHLAYFVAAFIIAVAAMMVFVSPASKATTQGNGCRAQCRVAYEKCVKQTSNPGGINQCRKQYEACLSGCN